MRKLIGTVVVVALVIYFGYQRIAIGLVSGAVEQATGAPVKIKQVHIKLVPLEVGIYGMKIMNADGYQEPELASIPEIFVRVDLSGIFKKIIHVKKISLNIEHVTVEKTQKGKINLKDVLDHSKKKPVKQSDPSAPAPKPTSGPQEKKAPVFKLKIDETYLSLGKVVFVDYGNGQRVVRGLDLKVDNLLLKNVADMDSLTEQIVVLILKKIGALAIGMQADLIASNLEEQAGQLLNSAKTKISTLFNKN